MASTLAYKISKETFLKLIDQDIITLDYMETQSGVMSPSLTVSNAGNIEGWATNPPSGWQTPVRQFTLPFQDKIESLLNDHFVESYAVSRSSWHKLAETLSDKEWFVFWLHNYNLSSVAQHCEAYNNKEESSLDASKA